MALGRVVAGELFFGISAGDPLTNLAVIAVVLTGTATALVVPIRRAIHVDPVTILRD